MLQTLALATLVSLAPAQGSDDLKLSNVRSTYGMLGAPRTDTKLVPGDWFWLTFDIENMYIDPETGRSQYSMGMEILDAQGNRKFGKKPQDVEAVNFFGGSSVPASAHVEIGSDTDPGEYTMVITVTDRGAKPNKSATLKRSYTVLPKGFGIVRVSTTLDSAGTIPAPSTGTAGQFYHFNFYTVGFERSKSSPDREPSISYEMTILDDKGKPTLTKPIAGEAGKDVPASLKVVPMQLILNLNRPGKFTMTLKATDNISKKKAEVSFPLTVLESSSK